MTFAHSFGDSGQKITPAQIVAQVAAKHGISVRELTSRGRHRYIAWARQEAMARLRDMTAWSLPKIGDYLGGLDHTTVLYGIRQHQARMEGRKIARKVAA